MRNYGKQSAFDILKELPSIVRNRKHLLHTPISIALTLVITGVPLCYYKIFDVRRKNQSTELYKQSLKLLESYEPVHKYIGTPYKVRWMQEAYHDDNTVTMVVPIKGRKANAKLYIIGNRGTNDEVVLGHLDIELTSQKRRWTFYRQVAHTTKQTTVTTANQALNETRTTTRNTTDKTAAGTDGTQIVSSLATASSVSVSGCTTEL